jgi:hypothetical protein
MVRLFRVVVVEDFFQAIHVSTGTSWPAKIVLPIELRLLGKRFHAGQFSAAQKFQRCASTGGYV